MAVTADFIRRIAAAAAAETLPRFRQEGAVSNKLESGFDPVTEADREAERAIRWASSRGMPADRPVKIGSVAGGLTMVSRLMKLANSSVLKATDPSAMVDT